MEGLIGRDTTMPVGGPGEHAFSFRNPPKAVLEALNYALLNGLPIEIDGIRVVLTNLDMHNEVVEFFGGRAAKTIRRDYTYRGRDA